MTKAMQDKKGAEMFLATRHRFELTTFCSGDGCDDHYTVMQPGHHIHRVFTD
jgi:hypothetical protein